MASINSRSVVISKTAYELLAVESGEESEDEQVEATVPLENVESATEEPRKLSKSALKKAQNQARTERRREQRALARANKAAGATGSLPVDSASASPAVSSPGSAVNPSKPLPDVEPPSESTAPASAPQPIAEVKVETKPKRPAAPTNGHVDTKVMTHAEPPPWSKKVAKLDKPIETSPPVTEQPISKLAKVEETPTAPTPKQKPDNNEISRPVVEEPKVPTPEELEREKKRQNMLTRTLWTFIMIGGFLGLLLMGHAYMVLLVMLCQSLVYREVTALFSLKTASKELREGEDGKTKDPWSKTLNWYFFAVANYFLYGESIIYYFKHVVFADAQLLPFVTNHRMISFILYIIGFMGFVMSLKKGHLKQQFGLFCWVHMSLLLIVVSSHFIVNNILEGLIWFWVPASLVICNDVFAYVWGITLGRTPLIKLSPKKTVEGFVGAFWSTILFSLCWGTYFMRFKYMICPVHDLGVNAWSSIQCTPNPVFVWREWHLWNPLAAFLSGLLGRSVETIPYAPYQFHLLFMACFASLVAPFGGFFASGFKRAFNIKDFGQSIPGHGGMTDRMDCQFLMGIFTYVYYTSLIRQHHVTVGSVLQTIVSGLTVEQQLELIADLKKYLVQQGIQVP
ncbi:hypothetical protein AX16_002028 [Volvariella volvacea WC 439]|nr:hypothetical protein AX16_002028 [Volvariella volvacea WC 439]